jgi:hypothetical protein
MANLRRWSSSASGNATVTGGVNTINFAEGQTPGSVNNSAREMMAQVRSIYTPAEWGWVEHSATASVASQTAFKISGNQTTNWTAGRRWRLMSGSTTRYGSVVSASFTAETTVTVTVDSGSLSASHSLAALAAIDTNNVPSGYARLASTNTFTANQTILGSAADAYSYLQGNGFNAISFIENYGTATASQLRLNKSRGTLASPTIVSNGDEIGSVLFYGFDGATLRPAASVGALVDNTPGASDMPGRLIFNTTADGAAAPTERMRIDSGGNVGIGGTPVAIYGRTLQIGDGSTTSSISLLGTGSGTTGDVFLSSTGSEALLASRASTPLLLGTGDTERMRIDASGFVGVGQTPDGDARMQVRETGSASRRAADFYLNVASSTATPAARFIKHDNDTTTSNKFVEFTINQNGAGSGQINANGASQAAFGSFSDIRLKENVTNLPSQLGSLMALRPVEFDYKDGSGHQIGFIAQEMQAIYPDAVGRDGEYLTLSGYGKTEARLIKALQEAVAKIDALEARIAALEAA